MEAARRVSRIDNAARAMDGGKRGNSPSRHGWAGSLKSIKTIGAPARHG